MTQTDKEIIDRITMVCQSDAGVKLGYDDTAWTDKEKLVQIMRILGKTTQTDKEKIMQEALKAIDDLIKHYERMKTAMKEGLADAMIEDLVGIKKILES